VTAPFRPELDGLVPYEPGRPVEIVQRELGLAGPIVKLASNEGPWGPVPAALEAIVAAARAGNRYPDGGCYALRSALAERHGLAFGQVVVGNGADGVLNYLALALLEPGDEVAFCWPSFPVYPINAAKMGAVAVRAPLAGSSYDLEALAASVNERTKIAYVTNPNNPTGGMVTRTALERFLDGLPEHVLPVLDEAYFEYVDDPEYPDGASEQLARGRRCVVLRTFSKIYGLAGISMGYAVAPKEHAATLKRAGIGAAAAFDRFAIAASIGSLLDADYIQVVRAKVVAEREKWNRLFDSLKVRHSDSRGNFVFFETRRPHTEFSAELRSRGIDIGRAFAPLENWARISIGLPSENDTARKAVADLLG